jgi:hypothetical protein
VDFCLWSRWDSNYVVLSISFLLSYKIKNT